MLPLETQINLMRFIQVDVCKETKAVLSYNPLSIRFPKEDSINYSDYQTSLLKYTDIINAPLWQVRLTWCILKMLNQNLEQCGPFINMELSERVPFSFTSNTLLL